MGSEPEDQQGPDRPHNGRRHFLVRAALTTVGLTAVGTSDVAAKAGKRKVAARDPRILAGAKPPRKTQGRVGDFYVDGRRHHIYGPKSRSGWGDPTNLIGPSGKDGISGRDGKDGISGRDGKDGISGRDGYTVLSGVGAPSSLTGRDKDFYIDTSTSQMYGPKTGGVWGSPANLVGPQGPAGTGGGSYLGDFSALPGGFAVKANEIVSRDGVLYGRKTNGTLNGSFVDGDWTVLAASSGHAHPNQALLPLTGAPQPSDGVDGQMAIDSVNAMLYGPKTNGQWPAGVPLRGPQGPAGTGGSSSSPKLIQPQIVGARPAASGFHYSAMQAFPSTVNGVNARLRTIFPDGAGSVIFEFSNTFAGETAFDRDNFTDADMPGDMTISCAIEINNVIVPVRFGPDGATSVTIPGGGSVESLPVAVDVDPTKHVFVRTYATWAAHPRGPALSGPFPVGVFGGLSGESVTWSAAEPDRTRSTGTLPAGSPTLPGLAHVLMPRAVRSTEPVPHPVWLPVSVQGDSITADLQAWPNIAFSGYLGVDKAVPYMSTSRSTEQLTQFMASPYGSTRRAQIRGCRAALCAYGINDMGLSGTTLQTMKALIGSQIAMNVRRGVERIIIPTLTPATERTSTSTGWTVANQVVNHPSNTRAAREPVRLAYNDWLRQTTADSVGDRHGELSSTYGVDVYVWDLCGLVATNNSAGEQVWNDTPKILTSDGLHPSNGASGGAAYIASNFPYQLLKV